MCILLFTIASSVSKLISITVIGLYFDMISPIATFVLIPIIDQAEWTCHLFTPVIGENLGLIVYASEYSHRLKVCYHHLSNISL